MAVGGMFLGKDVIDTVGKKILEQYLGGKDTISDIVDAATREFREALLETLNGALKKRLADLWAGVSSEEKAYCPVDPLRVEAKLFMGACQIWQDIPQCFRDICHHFPGNRTSVISAEKENKENRENRENKENEENACRKAGFVNIDVEKALEMLDGSASMAEKLRNLRNMFLGKLGVDKLRELIRNTLKKGAVKVFERESYGNIDSWLVDLREGIESGVIKRVNYARKLDGGQNNAGVVKGLKKYGDGSYLIVVDESGKEKYVLPTEVIVGLSEE